MAIRYFAMFLLTGACHYLLLHTLRGPEDQPGGGGDRHVVPPTHRRTTHPRGGNHIQPLPHLDISGISRHLQHLK
jgi:hypothetical protein